jgi:hypothetical protein
MSRSGDSATAAWGVKALNGPQPLPWNRALLMNLFENLHFNECGFADLSVCILYAHSPDHNIDDEKIRSVITRLGWMNEFMESVSIQRVAVYDARWRVCRNLSIEGR